ncbi:MAG: hypothetical protein ABIR47_05030 [Candidatus Kapaibacterium sp.]
MAYLYKGTGSIARIGTSRAEGNAGSLARGLRMLAAAVAFCAAFCSLALPLLAQGGRAVDNILYPQPEPLPILGGPEVGYGNWTNKGYFTVPDGKRSCSAFDNGTGKGLTIGIKGIIYVTPWLFISPRIRYEARSGSFVSPLPGEPVRAASNAIVMLDQEAQVDATISALSIDGTIGVEAFGFYIFGGGSSSLLLDGVYNYTERLTGSKQNFQYADSRTAEHRLVSGRAFDGYEKSTFDLRGGAGLLLDLSYFTINPEVFYSSPLTSALHQPNDLKQTGFVGTIAILFSLR